MYMFLGDNYKNGFFTYKIITDGWKFQWEFELLHHKFIECGPFFCYLEFEELP